ncbi:MAG: glycerophosphodiester phosphodiesterase family protein [Eubacteriaceae bacterium]|jgi:glycerophosphoryl diester phosphodiesterase
MKSFRKSLIQVLGFEILFKAFVLALVSPVLNLVIREMYSYYNVFRLSAGMLETTVFAVTVVIIAIVLVISIFIFNYFEISAILILIDKNVRGKKLGFNACLNLAFSNTLRQLHLKNWRAVLYFVVLIPFTGTGYLVSAFPRLAFPSAVLNYLERYAWGPALENLIYVLIILIAVGLVFIPVAMVLRQQNYQDAWKTDRYWFRMLPVKQSRTILTMFLTWAVCTDAVRVLMPIELLRNNDITISILRSQIFSQSYMNELILWICYTLLQTLIMIMFLYTLVNRLEMARILKPEIYRAGTLDANSFRKLGFKRRLMAGMVAVVFAVTFYTSIQKPLVHVPWVIGHRGTNTEVENSTTGVKAAAAQGADYAELDVHLSSDGEAIVVHDKNLRGLAKVDKNVGDLTLAEIKQLSVTQHGKTEKIPTLEEMIEAAQSTPEQIGLLIELKPDDGNDRELAEKVIEIVEKTGFQKKAIFMSFSLDSVRALSYAHPEWWIGHTAEAEGGQLDSAVWEYDVDFLALDESQITPQLLTLARENMIPIYVWTVTTESDARKYYDMGAEGVITNSPSQAKKARDDFLSSDTTTNYYYSGAGYPQELTE